MYAMREVESVLHQLAPAHLAESWDNVGLIVGDPTSQVQKVLCALDLNEQVVDEAIANQAQCIVLHHPFIFKPLKQIDTSTSQGRIIKKLIKHDINVFAMHTNFDIATGGMNDYLVNQLGLGDSRILKVTGGRSCVKVVIYVPETHFASVRDTMITWNPCKIGNYSGCTFSTRGEGTFRPEEGSNPYIGSTGDLEKVEEVKLEFMTYTDQISDMLQVLKTVHPYEEVAWDAFELKNMQEPYGLGRIASCEPTTISALVEKVKEVLNIPYVRLITREDKKVSRIAICSGSGSSLIGAAAKSADVYITGDIGFHDAQGALDAGLTIIDVGHYASENIGMQVVKDYLEQNLDTVEVLLSEVNGEVFKVI